MRRCTVTSSALVGSSAMMSSGERAIAIAMSTRWRMPPESSCGYCVARSAGIVEADALEQLEHAVPDVAAVAPPWTRKVSRSAPRSAARG